MRNFVVFLLAIVFNLSHAQVDNLGRFEIEHNTIAQDYVLIPNFEHGALLVIPRFSPTTADNPVELYFLDAQLNQKWNYSLYIEKRYNLIGYYGQGSVSYLLFQNRSNNLFTKLVRIDPLNDEVKEFEPKSIVDLEITEFEVVQNTAILGGYFQQRPAVFAYDMESDKVRTLSNVYQRNSELIEVRVNADSLTFNVLASVLTPEKDRTLIVNSYDYGGNALRDYELQIPPNYQLLTGVSSSIVNKEQLVVGLYTVNTGTYPSGIFVNHVDKTGRQDMKFYNFGQFDSFLDHTGKRADKLKQKALESLKSKKEWRFKTDGLFRELIERDGEFIFVGEYYKPWNISSANYQRTRDQMMTLYDNYDRSRPALYPPTTLSSANAQSLSGMGSDLNYTHAFAFGMDLQGNVLWDGSLELDETKETNLSFLGDFTVADKNTYYAYYHNELLIASHLNAESDTAQYVGPIELQNESDQLKFERDGYRSLVRWYDNKFLVQGIQHIRNGPLRKVYFINAVEIGPEFVTTTPRNE